MFTLPKMNITAKFQAFISKTVGEDRLKFKKCSFPVNHVY